MEAITNALKDNRFAVVFDMNNENKSTKTGPDASNPNLTGLSASLYILLYHIRMKSAIGSSLSF